MVGVVVGKVGWWKGGEKGVDRERREKKKCRKTEVSFCLPCLSHPVPFRNAKACAKRTTTVTMPCPFLSLSSPPKTMSSTNPTTSQQGRETKHSTNQQTRWQVRWRMRSGGNVAVAGKCMVCGVRCAKRVVCRCVCKSAVCAVGKR